MFRAILFCAFILMNGCVARTFVAEQKSADTLAAHPEGNRGYLMGKPGPDAPEAKPRKVPTMEIELGLRPDDNPTLKKKTPPVEPYPAAAPAEAGAPLTQEPPAPATVTAPETGKEYVIQPGDTLQKISQKLYGTTRNWHKLYLLRHQ